MDLNNQYGYGLLFTLRTLLAVITMLTTNGIFFAGAQGHLGIVEHYYVVAENGLSLRARPDTRAVRYEVLPWGTMLVSSESQEYGYWPDWLKVEWNGQVGYVSKEYIVSIKPPMEQMSANDWLHSFKVVGESENTYDFQYDPEDSQYTVVQKRTLFENGIIMVEVFKYEYGFLMIIIPNISLSGAKNLVKLLDFGNYGDYPQTVVEELYGVGVKITHEDGL